MERHPEGLPVGLSLPQYACRATQLIERVVCGVLTRTGGACRAATFACAITLEEIDVVHQAKENWQRLGSVEDLKTRDLQQLEIGHTLIALSYRNGEFGAVSGRCNHAGGPLGHGLLNDDFIVCPWHSWMFHRLTGEARPGIPAAVPRHVLRVQDGDLYIDIAAATPRIHAPHAKHPLSRDIVRDPGPLRVAGISTTVMNAQFPRYSTSEGLLRVSLDYAGSSGIETRLIRLN